MTCVFSNLCRLALLTVTCVCLDICGLALLTMTCVFSDLCGLALLTGTCVCVFSDPLHTYLGLCGLALMGEPGLATVHPALNISQRAADHLFNIHKKWES